MDVRLWEHAYITPANTVMKGFNQAGKDKWSTRWRQSGWVETLIPRWVSWLLSASSSKWCQLISVSSPWAGSLAAAAAAWYAGSGKISEMRTARTESSQVDGPLTADRSQETINIALGYSLHGTFPFWYRSFHPVFTAVPKFALKKIKGCKKFKWKDIRLMLICISSFLSLCIN